MANAEWFELNRTTSKVVAVASGFFHVTGDEFDETVDLPEEDQGGAAIEMKVVHAVQMTTGKGEIMILHFNVPKAKNASGVESDYNNKETETTDGGDNQMQTSKVDDNLISKGNSMKSVLSVGDNIT